MKALIYKSTGSWYQAKTLDGKTFQCRIKGIFKIDGITSTNPIAVGDEVEIELENEEGEVATIIDIHERKIMWQDKVRIINISIILLLLT